MSAAIFLNNGQPFQVGDKLVQRDLAKTLKEIGRRGTDGFYKGWVGAAIVKSSQGGGVITQADLDQYSTREMLMHFTLPCLPLAERPRPVAPGDR